MSEKVALLALLCSILMCSFASGELKAKAVLSENTITIRLENHSKDSLLISDPDCFGFQILLDGAGGFHVGPQSIERNTKKLLYLYPKRQEVSRHGWCCDFKFESKMIASKVSKNPKLIVYCCEFKSVDVKAVVFLNMMELDLEIVDKFED